VIHNETYNMVIHIYTGTLHTVTHPYEFVQRENYILRNDQSFFCLLCAIGRRPKADNFGSNRDKREKDFFSFFSQLQVVKEGFAHSF